MMSINILLIEDNLGDARLVQEMVSEINIETDKQISFFHITSLEGTLNSIVENSIDIVFLDLGLPGSNGEETVKLFRKLDKKIPLVAYTGNNDVRLGATLLQVGADDYICKIDATPSVIAKTIWLNIQRSELKHQLKEKEKMLIVQSRSAAMGEMIGMIAHQWKQPLAILSMSANNMIADFQLGDAKVESFETYGNEILHQVEHLSDTIDDFRNFFRPVSEKVEFSIEKVINDSLQLISKSLDNNQVKVNIEIEPQLGTIKIFPNELSHVLLNLLNNAKEALIQNQKENREIRLKCYKKDFLYIEVEDNGGGVEETFQERLFEPYFTTKEKLNGTGLGLYISKTIIEEHFNGVLMFENIDKGAKFTIKISLS